MENKKKLNILIINAHWKNRGDEAAIRAMIDSFKSKLPVKKIRIMFYGNMKNEMEFLNEDIELLKTFPYFEVKFSFFVIFCIDFFFSLITLGKFALSKSGKEFISAINDSDFVIHAPGGPGIGDLYSGIIEFFYLYKLFLAKIKGKRVYIYAPSMGPFSGKFKNFMRKFVLKMMDIIIVRDQISRNYLKDQLNLDSYQTLDSAFQNDIPQNYLEKYSDIDGIINILKNEKVIGMTITDLFWHPLYADNTLLKDNIIKSLQISIKYFVKKGYYVLIIPQLFGRYTEHEQTLINTIKLDIKENLFVLPNNLDSYAQQIVISNLFCVIGMRYHPNIFAAKMNIPSIAISYEHKTNGFMEELGHPDLVINVNEIDEKIIIDKFNFLEDNYDKIKSQIKTKIPYLKEKSKKTTELIINDLKKIIQI